MKELAKIWFQNDFTHIFRLLTKPLTPLTPYCEWRYLKAKLSYFSATHLSCPKSQKIGHKMGSSQRRRVYEVYDWIALLHMQAGQHVQLQQDAKMQQPPQKIRLQKDSLHFSNQFDLVITWRENFIQSPWRRVRAVFHKLNYRIYLRISRPV